MRKKQTIKVKDLKKQVNDYLKFDTLNQDEKKGLCILLERVLSETGNYEGYHNQWDKDIGVKDPLKYDRVYY